MRVARATRVSAAIERFRTNAGETVDAFAADVLARLSESQAASSVFDKMNVDDRAGTGILITCIQADEIARTFQGHIAAEKAMSLRLDGLSAALKQLKEFWTEETIRSDTPDRLSATIRFADADVRATEHGLSVINSLIEGRRRICAETLPRLGAARTVRGGEVNAAVGWLVEGVVRYTGRPHYNEVADLASIICKKEISVNQVAKAYRNRKEWRAPLHHY